MSGGGGRATGGILATFSTMSFNTHAEKPIEVTSVKVMPGCMASVTSGMGTGASEFKADGPVNNSGMTGVYCVYR